MTDAIAPLQSSAFEDTDVPVALVSEMVKLLSKAVRAHQLYLPNNPMHTRAIEAVQSAAQAIWAQTQSLELLVTESELQYQQQVVLEETGRSNESLPWLFFRDGIRSITFQPGAETHDLIALLDMLQRVRQRTIDDDDLVTLLWECDFAHFQYRYVDVITEGGPVDAEANVIHNNGLRRGTILSPVETETGDLIGEGVTMADVVETPASFVRIEDFDTTLYFLDEQEVAYLQTAIRNDFETDLRPSVISALLDTYEQQPDRAVREEICNVLDQVLLSLLSTMQLGTVAYFLHEVSVVMDRAPAVTPEQRAQLALLSDRLSDPSVLTQLLQAIDDLSDKAIPPDILNLLRKLKPTALAPILAQLGQTQSAELSAVLEDAVSRLAGANTDELVRLIGSSDETVAMQAIQRSGALRSPAAVGPLSLVLNGTETELRRMAADALAEIGSPGAMQVLERAIDDRDRDVRVIALRALADRRHRAALKRIERAIKERVVNEPASSEKTAFFDTYATLAGNDGVGFLDTILNPRGFLKRKEDPQTRACAALALGKIGSPKAVEALRDAVADKEVVVRNAAARALRGNA